MFKTDVKLFLQTCDGEFWVANVHHNGWEIVEEFTWLSESSDVDLIKWLERLVEENKITIADAIRVGVYYGQK